MNSYTIFLITHEPCQTSKLKPFVKTVDGLAVNYFHKKHQYKMFESVLNTPLEILTVIIIYRFASDQLEGSPSRHLARKKLLLLLTEIISFSALFVYLPTVKTSLSIYDFVLEPFV